MQHLIRRSIVALSSQYDQETSTNVASDRAPCLPVFLFGLSTLKLLCSKHKGKVSRLKNLTADSQPVSQSATDKNPSPKTASQVRISKAEAVRIDHPSFGEMETPNCSAG